MTCHEFLRALDAYLDDELSVTEVLDMHGHLGVCEPCRRVLESEAALHALVAGEIVDDEPPRSLRTRILQRVGAGSRRSPEPPPRGSRFSFLQGCLAGAALAGLVLVALIAGSKSPDVPAPLAAELAAKHVLYTGGPSADLAITTADGSQMAAWLEHRLGFSATLPRLNRPEERLVGGRVSSIADAPAAYLLYERQGRRVSLFVTQPLPFAKLGWTERVVDGVELYTAAVGDIRLVWWEDEADHRLYAAASVGGARELLEFALLCVRGGHLARLSLPATVLMGLTTRAVDHN
jgi:anti-sigma factor RsiW